MSPANAIRTKFAVGHYLTDKLDDPASFSVLAQRFAPRLREVYFPWPGLSNARAKVYNKPDDEERIAADLAYCRAHGMKLDLLANATCYGDKAFTEEQRLQIVGIIRHLDKLGLYPEIITTTSPYIAKVFKLNFPDIEVRASVNMRLRNTLALEYLAPLYDSYYICRDVQRDLPTFRKMAAWCKDNGKKLCLLANSGCVRNCPWQVFHETLLSHKFTDAFPEMQALRRELLCTGMYRKRRLVEFLRCSWIRPEDIHVFEPYLETIKLSTREAKFPLVITEAYVNGSYDGNLLRLTDPSQPLQHKTKGIRMLKKGNASYAVMEEYDDYEDMIDNKSFPADWITSGIAGKCADNCVHCGKCEQILKLVSRHGAGETARPATAGLSFINPLGLVVPDRKNDSRPGMASPQRQTGGKGINR